MVGCAKPEGVTKEEKRDYIQKMKEDTMAELYAKQPEARYLIESAAGYGVFSNVSTHLLFLGGGSGYGVVVDKATGKPTYIEHGTGRRWAGIGYQRL